ncbi:MAG TPA: polysaccharide deacetylase family protein [Rubrobacter sp.]|jgi:peptidoglycan/xylan/chitin deacetylase (PgdA/CDA1 family)
MHSVYRSPAPVALTFDDGPDPVWTPLVLDALANAGARATFFVVAPRATRYPSLISSMREKGHDVAFHCSEHVRHDAMTRREIEADVESGLLALGRSVRYWRSPWGLITLPTEEVANKHRLGLVGWTADTEDWRGGAPEEMLARIRGRISPGAIVLMHDGIGPGATRDVCSGTVDLIGPLVALLRSHGLEPATLGELQHPLPDRNPDFRAG